MSDSWHQGEVHLSPQTGRGFIFELEEAKRAGPDVHRITKFTLVVVIQEGFYITPQLRLCIWENPIDALGMTETSTPHLHTR